MHGATGGGGIRVRDDRGRLLRLPGPPRRIVSLVPSDTYSLLVLGAGERLVGRTAYCRMPDGTPGGEAVAAVAEVGGTKNADVEAIVDVRPDLVIANQEENTRGDVERLEAAGVPVFVSFPTRVAEGVAHLARLAVLLGERGATGPAREAVAAAYHALRNAERRRSDAAPIATFVPIWMDPLMTVHGETFISDVLDVVGLRNVFADRPRRYPLAADLGQAPPAPPERSAGRDTRYPRVTLAEVVARAPRLVLLPDEPHPFSEADAATFRSLAIPAAPDHVRFCNGKDLMWYGARAAEGLERLAAFADAARGAPAA